MRKESSVFRCRAGLHPARIVEPIPYAGYWIMLAEAPPSGSTIDCLPIAKAKSGGEGWWHDAMGVDVSKATRGAGIKVGVIDTGCGPHRNLAHVTLVGAFVDGKVLAPAQATDVAEHGTHTSGIVGARRQNHFNMPVWRRAVIFFTPVYLKAKVWTMAPRRRTLSTQSILSHVITNATSSI